jgi:hypothetical protein
VMWDEAINVLQSLGKLAAKKLTVRDGARRWGKPRDAK